MEATALYNFDSTQDDELSFRQGDVVKVKNLDDGNWYQAEIRGKIGYVPSTYIKLDYHDWYKGKMSRTEAEQQLMRTDSTGRHLYPDGAFLIRDCESDKNQFSLSVKHGSIPQHFKILSSPEGQYYLWPNKMFSSINKLIDFHRTTSIARDSRTTILLRDAQESRSSELFEAQHDFDPQSPEEVRFRRGDRIRLIEKTDENWWTGLVLSTNQQGLFPRNYVKAIPS